MAYLTSEVKNNDHIVQSNEVTEYLKSKFNEYARRESRAFERQVKGAIDAIFADLNTTNIRKSFYRKKDLVQVDEGGQGGEEDGGPIIDKYGEELVEHTSKNTMNELILANNSKQA